VALVDLHKSLIKQPYLVLQPQNYLTTPTLKKAALTIAMQLCFCLFAYAQDEKIADCELYISTFKYNGKSIPVEAEIDTLGLTKSNKCIYYDVCAGTFITTFVFNEGLEVTYADLGNLHSISCKIENDVSVEIKGKKLSATTNRVDIALLFPDCTVSNEDDGVRIFVDDNAWILSFDDKGKLVYVLYFSNDC
jgi:hypothetical protein